MSKACATIIAQAYSATYDLPVAVTCCANLYGGGDLNWSRLIPATIRSVLRAEPPIIRSDGTLLRDYLYVQDAVRAYVTLGEQLDRADVKGELFNFGTDRPKSVLEVVQTIVALSECPWLEPVVLDNAPGEIQDQYLDSTKARRLLGWSPTFSFEEGLGGALAWYRAFLAEQVQAEASS